MIKAFLRTIVILIGSASTWVSAQNQYTVQPGDTACEIAELFEAVSYTHLTLPTKA